MATVLHGVTIADTTNGTSYASGAFTPVLNDLLVVWAVATATIDPGTLTDSQGLGWYQVGTGTKNTGLDTSYLWVATALAAASSMTVTFTCPGDAATGCALFVARVSTMQRVGVQAVRQAKINPEIAAGTQPSITFDVACLTGNPTLGFVATGNNPAALTEPVGWTEQQDTGYGTPACGAEYVSRDSGFTGTVMTWTGATSTKVAMGIELDTSAPPVPTPAQGGQDRTPHQMSFYVR